MGPRRARRDLQLLALHPLGTRSTRSEAQGGPQEPREKRRRTYRLPRCGLEIQGFAGLFSPGVDAVATWSSSKSSITIGTACVVRWHLGTMLRTRLVVVPNLSPCSNALGGEPTGFWRGPVCPEHALRTVDRSGRQGSLPFSSSPWDYVEKYVGLRIPPAGSSEVISWPSAAALIRTREKLAFRPLFLRLCSTRSFCVGD